jgi:hypothetical protein
VVYGADSAERTMCRKGRLLRELHNLHALRSEILLVISSFLLPQPQLTMRRSIFLSSPMVLHLSRTGSIPTALCFSRANVTRSRLPPEVHVRSRIILTTFGKQCPVTLALPFQEFWQLYAAGPLVQGPAPNTNARSSPPSHQQIHPSLFLPILKASPSPPFLPLIPLSIVPSQLHHHTPPVAPPFPSHLYMSITFLVCSSRMLRPRVHFRL